MIFQEEISKETLEIRRLGV